MTVIPTCLGISVYKYTDLPSNTTTHFYSNTATCFSPLQTLRHAFK